MIDYKKRLVEVDEILSCLPKDEYEKIPKDIIESIKDNKDKEYIWKYDESKPLKEQKISRDTIIILSYLNTEYLVTDEQKVLLKEIYKMNYSNRESRLEQINADNLFKKEEKENILKITSINEQNSVTVYKENIFKRVLKKILNK